MSALFLKSLVAGAAEGAGESIEKRNTEIRKNAMAEFEMLRKEAGEKTEKLQTKRDELTSMAGALSSYRDGQGVQLTETQITGLLMQPIKAKQILKTLESEKDLSSIDFQKLLKVGGKVEMAPEEYIKRTTSIPQGLPQSQPTQVPKGAFGLESPAYGEAQSQFEAASGRKLSDIRAMALTPTERIEPVPLEVDLSQFKNPEALSTVQNRLRDNIANGQDLGSPENKKLLTKLRADATIKAMFEGDGEGGKPRTTSAINSVIDKSLRAGLDPFVVKGVVRFDPQANDYVPITGDTKAIADFMDHKNKLIQSQAKALSILDKDNKIVGGRNASDALLPYANIEDGKVVSWKSAVTPKPAEAEAPVAGPKVGAPSIVTEKPLSIPKTQDGKIDGRKLVPGQTYTDASGKVKIWNGTSFQ